MSGSAETADDEAEPITDHTHDNSWSANLERKRHRDHERLLADARMAVEHTVAGNHVNLVTHAEHGHPETYLFALLEEIDDAAEWEFVDQCGCGGYVTRVYVR